MKLTPRLLRSATLLVIVLAAFLLTRAGAQIVSTTAPPVPRPTTNPVKVNPAITNPAVTNRVNVERPPASFAPQGLNRLSTAQRAALGKTKPALKQLPEFALTDRDGKPVAASSLARKTHWLLLVRTEICLPCDRLMNALAASASPDLNNGLPYTIVVAGKTPIAGENVRANYAKLNSANWLADTKNQAVTVLKPRGTPMLYGMDGANILWSTPGTLGDPTRVEKLASGWLASAPKTSTASASSATGAAVTAAGAGQKQ